MFTDQQMAVFAKARRTLEQLVGLDPSPPPTDIEGAAAQFYAHRSRLPGSVALQPASHIRATLEAAAIARGLQTSENEPDRNLALRITGRAASTVTDDDDTCIAAAFSFVVGGAS